MWKRHKTRRADSRSLHAGSTFRRSHTSPNQRVTGHTNQPLNNRNKSTKHTRNHHNQRQKHNPHGHSFWSKLNKNNDTSTSSSTKRLSWLNQSDNGNGMDFDEYDKGCFEGQNLCTKAISRPDSCRSSSSRPNSSCRTSMSLTPVTLTATPVVSDYGGSSPGSTAFLITGDNVQNLGDSLCQSQNGKHDQHINSLLTTSTSSSTTSSVITSTSSQNHHYQNNDEREGDVNMSSRIIGNGVVVNGGGGVPAKIILISHHPPMAQTSA